MSGSLNLEINSSYAMNFNLSVAFMDTVFAQLKMMKLEKDNSSNNDERSHHLLASDQQMNREMESSTYLIKNVTGEVVKFQTNKLPEFVSLRPDEISPLHFVSKKA